MRSFVAELVAVPNPLAEERLVCGLLAVTPDRLYFDYSRSKLRDAEARMPAESEQYLHSLLKVVHHRLRDLSRSGPAHGITKNLLDSLAVYDDGALRFTEPRPVAQDMNEEMFNHLFNSIVQPTASHPRRSMRGRMEQAVLERPHVRSRVDMGYVLPHEQLPGLILPAEVDMITVNGALTCAQGCDLGLPSGSLFDLIGRNETISRSLQAYGRSLDEELEVNPMMLVVQYSEGTAEEAIATRLREEKSDVFRIVRFDQFEDQLNVVEQDPNYQKFSSRFVTTA